MILLNSALSVTATISLQDTEGFKHCHGPIFVRKCGNKALEAVSLGRNLVQVLVSFSIFYKPKCSLKECFSSFNTKKSFSLERIISPNRRSCLA